MSGASRISVVTGAGRGIGESIALELHARGDVVHVLDIDSDTAHSVAARLGERAFSHVIDVADSQQLRCTLQEIIDRAGRLDVLVNNAARTVSRSVWEIEEAEWDDVLGTNLRSVLVASQIAGRQMKVQGSGRIVNLASLAGQQGGLVAGAHYAASKAGIIVLTKIFARELAADGVTVNAVAPAAIDGPIMAAIGEGRKEAIAASIPVGRVGTAAEVAAAVGYLASDEAAFITGATLDVNGGVFMR